MILTLCYYCVNKCGSGIIWSSALSTPLVNTQILVISWYCIDTGIMLSMLRRLLISMLRCLLICMKKNQYCNNCLNQVNCTVELEYYSHFPDCYRGQQNNPSADRSKQHKIVTHVVLSWYDTSL